MVGVGAWGGGGGGAAFNPPLLHPPTVDGSLPGTARGSRAPVPVGMRWDAQPGERGGPPTLSPCPSCAQPGGAGGGDAPRAHPSLRTQPGPVPGRWHPAWGSLAQRRYSPPARAGLYRASQEGLQAMGGGRKLPVPQRSPRSSPQVEMPGEICWINTPPGPRPHADAAFGASRRSHPFPEE